jgi:5'-nucleotidase
VPHLNSPYLGANVYEKGTTKVAAPLKASTIIVKDGVRIGVVGAVTHDLPSLVSPAGISNLTIGDPVKAVNAEAKRLKSEGLADVVVAEYHEGAADGSGDAASQGGNFAPVYADTSTDVDVVFNGHTHQVYSWKDKAGAPLPQAGSYGQHLAKVNVGNAGGGDQGGQVVGDSADDTDAHPILDDDRRCFEGSRHFRGALFVDVGAEVGAVEVRHDALG